MLVNEKSNNQKNKTMLLVLMKLRIENPIYSSRIKRVKFSRQQNAIVAATRLTKWRLI